MSNETELFVLESFKGKKCKKHEGSKDLIYNREASGSLFPPFFRKIAQKIPDLPVRKDDIWLISYPRTGSTWCQEIVWLIANNIDVKQSASTMQPLRAPLLESCVYDIEYVNMIDTSEGQTPQYKRKPVTLYETIQNEDSNLNDLIKQALNPFSFIESMSSPRCLKTHLTVDMLPKGIETVKPKIVYTMRNPKDVCVSYYFLYKMITNIDIDFEAFCDLFLRGSLLHGSILNHYLGYWKKRNNSNILIIRYEDMKTDLKNTVREIATFLEKDLKYEEVELICNYVHFEKMRENKACNRQGFFEAIKGKSSFESSGIHFIRKGVVGDHINYMSPEMIEKFDKWIEESTKGTDLVF